MRSSGDGTRSFLFVNLGENMEWLAKVLHIGHIIYNPFLLLEECLSATMFHGDFSQGMFK